MTQQEIKQNERVQCTALHINIGDEYITYDNALTNQECEKLTDRLCDNFAEKPVKHEQFQSWFCKNSDPTPNFETRLNKNTTRNQYQPVKTRTDGFPNSPLPYLTNILNTLHAKK